jgi:hypothetical protein
VGMYKVNFFFFFFFDKLYKVNSDVALDPDTRWMSIGSLQPGVTNTTVHGLVKASLNKS